jgi:hypothetical protein
MSTREREVVQVRESKLNGRRSYVTPHPVRGGEYVILNRMSLSAEQPITSYRHERGSTDTSMRVWRVVKRSRVDG